MAGVHVEHVGPKQTPTCAWGQTPVIWVQLKPLSVLLKLHDAPKASKHGRDVEKVVVHGVLPSGATLERLVELGLFSLQNYEFMIRKRKHNMAMRQPTIDTINFKICC